MQAAERGDLSARGCGVVRTWPGQSSQAWPCDRGSPSRASRCRRDTGHAGPAQAAPTSPAPGLAPPARLPGSPAPRQAAPAQPGREALQGPRPRPTQPPPQVLPAWHRAPGARPSSHAAPRPAGHSKTRPGPWRRPLPPVSGLPEVVLSSPFGVALMPVSLHCGITLASQPCADLSPRVTERGVNRLAVSRPALAPLRRARCRPGSQRAACSQKVKPASHGVPPYLGLQPPWVHGPPAHPVAALQKQNSTNLTPL